MKKVAILTLNGYFNYGNRLQNYALQEVIKSLGFKVETVINDTKKMRKDEVDSTVLNKFQMVKEMKIKELYLKLNTKIENYLYKKKLDQQRTQIFKDFSSTYIAETDYSISNDNIPKDFFE